MSFIISFYPKSSAFPLTREYVRFAAVCWYREDNVDYNELRHYDQVTILLNEVKQRITYGSAIPNLCRCRRRPMVLFDKHNAELSFESLASLNVLYELWKDAAFFE